MRPPPTRALLEALRPRQWIKNVLVVAAPVAAGSMGDGAVVGRAAAAVAVFIAAAGATYLVNDTADVEIDRAHPRKRERPVASGRISVGQAGATAAVLAVAALVGAAVLHWTYAVVIAIYLAVNAWYSGGMKHIPGLELAAIASGFVLRAIGGGAATRTPLSFWFVVVVSGAALFVVAGKRSAELQRTADSGDGRPVLAHYTPAGLRFVRAVAAATAVVSYALWVLDQDLAIGWLAAVSLVPFAGAIARYSTVIERGLGEDPEDIVLRDRPFQLIGLCWLVAYGVGLYG
ncbi:MAG: decaprenyl-phosphate phosphoribosyltransferase [Actinomycetota bacterium]